jgi:hypothetical protein
MDHCGEPNFFWANARDLKLGWCWP